MAVEVGTEDMIFTEIVGDHEIVCDYAEEWFDCQGDAARWVARTAGCPCGFSAVRLICSLCKDFIMLSEAAVDCGGRCGAVYAPARLGYSLIEPLERRR